MIKTWFQNLKVLLKEKLYLIIGIVLVVVALISIMYTNIRYMSLEPREKAMQIAIKEFKKLGEKDINKEDLEIVNIKKDGVFSFYITSKENSIQITEEDLKIIRLNEEDR